MSEESNIDWKKHDFRRMMRPEPRMEPAVDEIVSQVVGKKIYQCDPRVIKLIVKWKAGKPVGSGPADINHQTESEYHQRATKLYVGD